MGLAMLGCALGLFAVFGLGAPESLLAPLMGIGLLLAGVGTYLLGRHLNVTRPKSQIDAALLARQDEITTALREGKFAPGGILPDSPAEAHQAAAEVLELERLQLSRALNNNHTLYFIPMHYYGFMWVAAGLVAIAAPLFT